MEAVSGGGGGGTGQLQPSTRSSPLPAQCSVYLLGLIRHVSNLLSFKQKIPSYSHKRFQHMAVQSLFLYHTWCGSVLGSHEVPKPLPFSSASLFEATDPPLQFKSSF